MLLSKNLSKNNILTKSDWIPLTTVEQTNNTISDPNGFTTTGSCFDGKTFFWKIKGDTTQTDGFQKNWSGWSQKITNLYPDFDPKTDEIEIGIEIANMPLSTAKYGLFTGVTDSDISVRGNITAAGGIAIFPNSTVNTNGGIIGPLSLGTNNSLATTSTSVQNARCRLRWLNQTSPEIRVTGDVSRSSGGDITVNSLGPAGLSFNSNINNWRLIVGHYHLSTISGTPTLACRIYHRRLRTTQVEFPKHPIGKLPNIGDEINIGVIGHSISVGYAAIGATTIIPNKITCVDNGLLLSSWPSNNPSPNRGLLHNFGIGLLNSGYNQVNFFRRGTPGISLSTMMSTNWQNLINDMVFAGKTPDLLIIEIGENDAQLGEGTLFAARLSKDINDIQRMYPQIRILIAEPVTTDFVGYPEIDIINSAIYSVIAENPTTRGLIPNDGITLADTVHPDTAGQDVAGTAGVTALFTLM